MGPAPVRLGDAALAARNHPRGQPLACHAARGREAPQLPFLLVQDAEVREEAVQLVGRVEERLRVGCVWSKVGSRSPSV